MTEIKQVTIADGVFIYNGDMREVLAALEPESVDSIVSDPPYGLAFMGKGWDHGVPGVPFWTEALRVLKPGGHLLAFGGTRTFHRLAVAIEDAGFEVRDTLSWMYGSGFPKSMDVPKAIDKSLGAERAVIGTQKDRWTGKGNVLNFATDRDQDEIPLTGGPATPEAEQWDGWGTALKPSWEPIVMARKPLTKPGTRPGTTKKATVAETVLEHGTGALNIDATRIGHSSPADLAASLAKNPGRDDTFTSGVYGAGRSQQSVNTDGRWPANTLLSHDEDCEDECVEGCPVRLLDEQSGITKSTGGNSTQINVGSGRYNWNVEGNKKSEPDGKDPGFGDTGGASRFFYSSKTSKKERNAGLPEGKKNDHPTVKPVAVMAWLVKMVTPPGGLVVDPFMGSGSTGVAAVQEGFRFIGIDLEPSYCNIAWHRLKHAVASKEGSGE